VASFEIAGSWPDGYNADVTVRNDGPEQLTGWVVTWTMPDGHEIRNLWNGVKSGQGNAITVRNEGWNATVPPGGSTTFGMTIDAQDDTRETPPLQCGGDE
jgi:cellulase/cellobiase CelA1